MRLIDADALLEEMVGITDGWLKPPKGWKWYEDSVRNAPTVGGWISVKDRLPEKQTPVLVYVPPYSDKNEEYAEYVGMAYYTYTALGGYWAGTDGNVYGGIGIIHDPTYWMPLPTKPKEEEHD